MSRIRILLADPPWLYADKLRQDADIKRSATDHYRTLNNIEIAMFLNANGPRDTVYNEEGWPHPSFREELADDAILFLWATNPFILDGSAQGVCKAWGFEPKQMVPWVKGRLTYMLETVETGIGTHEEVTPKLVLQTGMGFYTRGVSEHLLIATRGEATWLIKDRGVNGLIVAPEEAFILAPRGAHSAKPEEGYQLIERLLEPGHRMVELFARKSRPGWESYGDQLAEEKK